MARFPGVRGRIPNFVGAEAAARALAATPEWASAGVLKSNPDSPQHPVRTQALAEGKLLYLAVPRLTSSRPFLALDAERLGLVGLVGRAALRSAASIKGSATAGLPVGLADMDRIDLIVCGSVAVNPAGVRIGKGGGYSDLEFALAREAGLVGQWTTIATTVHPVQVLDEDLPETDHDFRVHLIVTPAGVHRTPGHGLHGPAGILWDHLDGAKIEAVPVLAALLGARPGQRFRTISEHLR